MHGTHGQCPSDTHDPLVLCIACATALTAGIPQRTRRCGIQLHCIVRYKLTRLSTPTFVCRVIQRCEVTQPCGTRSVVTRRTRAGSSVHKLALHCSSTLATADQSLAAFTRMSRKVVVTGAGGRTGNLIVKKLLEAGPDKFTVIGTVRSKQASSKATASAGLSEEQVVELDLAAATAAVDVDVSGNSATAGLLSALQGADALVICTSGVPQIKYSSLIGVIAGKLIGRKNMPSFTWKKGEKPEQIDWLGQKVQIDAAKIAGVKHVVLISSMGGTDPTHFLNTMGDQGNILQWKRKAEQYLVTSGLNYTIIHPGGLIDEEGGTKQLVLGLDDKLLANNPRNIPRADVATLAVACVGLAEAQNRSFDVIAVPPPANVLINNDPATLLSQLSGNNDYGINSQMQ